MKGKSSARDPFAGYTPVKVSVPVADLPEQPAAKPRRGKKYKFSKSKTLGDLSRAAILILVLIVSAALVLLIAAFSFGIIYDEPVRNAVSNELDEYANEIKPFSDAGRIVRRHVSNAFTVSSSAVSGKLFGDERKEEKPKTASVPLYTNITTAVAKGIANVSEHKERVRNAENIVDKPDEIAKDDVDAKDVLRTVDKSDDKDEPPKRTVDPRLKTFYGGGRNGRRIGEGGDIKTFYNGGRKGRSIGDWRRRTK